MLFGPFFLRSWLVSSVHPALASKALLRGAPPYSGLKWEHVSFSLFSIHLPAVSLHDTPLSVTDAHLRGGVCPPHQGFLFQGPAG